MPRIKLGDKVIAREVVKTIAAQSIQGIGVVYHIDYGLRMMAVATHNVSCLCNIDAFKIVGSSSREELLTHENSDVRNLVLYNMV